jgi:enoyl-CoA hydratase
MTETPDLVVDHPEQGVVVLTMNRPSRLNALNRDAVGGFCRTLDALAADGSVRVVVLTGAGRGFCVGLDLTSPLQSSSDHPPGVTEFYAGQEAFAGMVQRLRRLDKVVIAAVNGVAAGAGFALTLAADLRVAARSAAFHVGAVRIGLTAGECGISYHLPRLIGASRAFEVMLTGRPIGADEAERIGLVSAVVDDERVLAHALALAALVLRNSPYSTKHTKQLMWANLDAPSLDAALETENHAQILALMTDDFKEAQRAFVEKRPPVFTGR